MFLWLNLTDIKHFRSCFVMPAVYGQTWSRMAKPWSLLFFFNMFSHKTWPAPIPSLNLSKHAWQYSRSGFVGLITLFPLFRRFSTILFRAFSNFSILFNEKIRTVHIWDDIELVTLLDWLIIQILELLYARAPFNPDSKFSSS